jgi:sugar-specific transcriptional regulator TrmB
MSSENEAAANTLANLGLTASQAKIYLALFNHGKATANVIAKIAHVDRAETYRVIHTLERKGFIKRIVANPAEFEPIQLDGLLTTLIENRKAEVAKIEKEAKELFQQLTYKNRCTEQKKGITIAFPNWIRIIGETKKAIHQCKTRYIVTTIKGSQERLPAIKKEIWRAMEEGAHMICIIERPSKKNTLPKIVNILNKHPNFTLRYSNIPVKAQLLLEDNKRVWSFSESLISTSSREVPLLMTTNPDIVLYAQLYFNMMFRNSVLVKKRIKNSLQKLT